MDKSLVAEMALHMVYAVMVPSVLLGLLVGAFFGWSFRPAPKAVRDDA